MKAAIGPHRVFINMAGNAVNMDCYIIRDKEQDLVAVVH